MPRVPCSSRPDIARMSLTEALSHSAGLRRGGKKSRFSEAERRGKNERSAAGDARLAAGLHPQRAVHRAAHAHRSASGQAHGRDQLERRGLSAAVRPSSNPDLGASARKKRSFKAMVSPPRPSSQLQQSWTMANILRTDSKTTCSMKVDDEPANDDCTTMKRRTVLRTHRRDSVL